MFLIGIQNVYVVAQFLLSDSDAFLFCLTTRRILFFCTQKVFDWTQNSTQKKTEFLPFRTNSYFFFRMNVMAIACN